jgi:hypothetical protein
MQTFRPEKAPRDPKELADWLDRTMLQAQRAANTGSDSLPLRVLHVAPSRPQDGWLYNADGTNWNPGDGAGVYRYDASVPEFVLLGGTGGSVSSIPVSAYSATHAIVAGDAGYIIQMTGATAADIAVTCADTAATLGNGFCFYLEHAGTGTSGANKKLVFTPTTSTIDGAATITTYPGDLRLITSNGTNWESKLIRGGFIDITVADSPYTFTIPTGFTTLDMMACGGGGGGGGGRGSAGGAIRGGGGGGGGASVSRLTFRPSDLTAAAICAVGAGGAAGAGGSTADGANGSIGTETTVEVSSVSVLLGERGGGGGKGTILGGSGGGGAGQTGQGTDADGTTAGLGGPCLKAFPYIAASTRDPGGSGGGGMHYTDGSSSTVCVASWGGGGGGACGGSGGADARQGGNSYSSCGGGGGGGGISAGDFPWAGGHGGGIASLGSGVGGLPGNTSGSAGTTAAVGAVGNGGPGGGGGGSNTAGTGGAGAAGTRPGGGGGGGGGGTTTGGAGGAGGDGCIRIWYYP